MKRMFPLLLALLLLCGCTAAPAKTGETASKRYEATFLTLFDTVTTIVGYAETEADFTATAQAIHDDLLEYHQLYDIYNEYEGMNNLKTVNDHAGEAPVSVDRKIIDLLLFSKDLYTRTGGKVNIAMGSVLSLWHDARELGVQYPDEAALPDRDALERAAAHTDINSIQIDEEKDTVFFSDPEVRLDVGAIAKGYAVQQVCGSAPAGLLISVGGNVCATGPKPETGQPWVVGIQNPDAPEEYLHTIYVEDFSVVTSGDYQRYFTVDGVPPHHRPRHPVPRGLLAFRHHPVPRFRPGGCPFHRSFHPAPARGAGPAGCLWGTGHVGTPRRQHPVQPRVPGAYPHISS